MNGMSIENHQLVNRAFARPPVFGDVEQIKAIHLTAQPPIEEGKKKRFSVTVSYSGGFTETIDAEDKNDAIEEMRDSLENLPEECEVDITAMEVEL